jgi:hypothetical protein
MKSNELEEKRSCHFGENVGRAHSDLRMSCHMNDGTRDVYQELSKAKVSHIHSRYTRYEERSRKWLTFCLSPG